MNLLFNCLHLVSIQSETALMAGSDRWRHKAELGILYSSRPVVLGALVQNTLDLVLQALLLSCWLSGLDAPGARCGGCSNSGLEAEVGAWGGPVVLCSAAAGRLWCQGGGAGTGAGWGAGGSCRLWVGEGHAWKVDAGHCCGCCWCVWWGGWCSDCCGCEVRKCEFDGCGWDYDNLIDWLNRLIEV